MAVTEKEIISAGEMVGDMLLSKLKRIDEAYINAVGPLSIGITLKIKPSKHLTNGKNIAATIKYIVDEDKDCDEIEVDSGPLLFSDDEMKGKGKIVRFPLTIYPKPRVGMYPKRCSGIVGKDWG